MSEDKLRLGDLEEKKLQAKLGLRPKPMPSEALSKLTAAMNKKEK